ncbi:vacuolar protein sorting-associated protein 52 homolog [Zophobas morio]|uniref:vacuolar protein sorting-associated protein 52 homolog n=1 Tax=Zophobas morio TaxID=2755281 RepID=UPI003082F459
MTNNGALQKFSNYNDLNGKKPLEVDLTELEITKEDNLFDAVDIHIQENLEDELVKEALAQGLDLRVYAREIEEALENVQKDSVLDYARESSKIASLHFQIKNCEQLLEDAEQLLGQFQSNLGEISFKIQTLQTQSLSLNTKLVNRRGVYDQIYSFISNSLMPPDMINCICESEVNETYMQYLLKLDERIEFFQNKSEKDYLCKCDAQPSLDSLRMKAVEKVREFLLQRIYGLRKPNTNVQMYQQSFLLPNKYFFKFLKQHGRTSSQEVCLIYIETMQKIFLSFFRHYFQSLIKLNVILLNVY